MVCRKYRFLKLLNAFREIKLSASAMPRDIPTRLKNVIWGLSYRKPRERAAPGDQMGHKTFSCFV